MENHPPHKTACQIVVTEVWLHPHIGLMVSTVVSAVVSMEVWNRQDPPLVCDFAFHHRRVSLM